MLKIYKIVPSDNHVKIYNEEFQQLAVVRLNGNFSVKSYFPLL